MSRFVLLLAVTVLVCLFSGAQAQCSYFSCSSCTSAPGCGWCSSSATCLQGNSIGPSGPFSCSNWKWTASACFAPSNPTPVNLAIGTIVAIVCAVSGASVFTCLVLLGLVWWCRRRRREHTGYVVDYAYYSSPTASPQPPPAFPTTTTTTTFSSQGYPPAPSAQTPLHSGQPYYYNGDSAAPGAAQMTYESHQMQSPPGSGGYPPAGGYNYPPAAPYQQGQKY